MAQAIPDYLKWFDFSEPPFRLSPDVDFFYPSSSHKQALDVLRYGISRGEGFMVLSGQAGTGKTMLLRLLLRELPHDKEAAFIVTPAVDPKGLMGLLMEELGFKLNPERSELALMLKDFQENIIRLAKEKRGILIVVDEAQDLPLETVEQLRLLSNIETGKQKLVQILLVGQPEIQALLSDPRLCQLTQRIVINEKLKPLSEPETRDYVRFRISKAGRADLGISHDFFKGLYKRTSGLPRLINRAMDRSLLMAAASCSKGLEASHLSDALSTLPEPGTISSGSFRDGLKNLFPTAWKNVAFAGIGCMLGIALCFPMFKAHHLNTPIKRIQPLTASSANSGQKALLTPGAFKTRVIVTRARIHLRPDKTSPVVTLVRKGQDLTVIERKKRWFKVMAKSEGESEFTGWLLKKQVEREIGETDIYSQKEMDRTETARRPI